MQIIAFAILFIVVAGHFLRNILTDKSGLTEHTKDIAEKQIEEMQRLAEYERDRARGFSDKEDYNEFIKRGEDLLKKEGFSVAEGPSSYSDPSKMSDEAFPVEEGDVFCDSEAQNDADKEFASVMSEKRFAEPSKWEPKLKSFNTVKFETKNNASNKSVDTEFE